jgi:hypothetical protein
VKCPDECGGVCSSIRVVVYAKPVDGAICIDSVTLARDSFGNGVRELGVIFGECRIDEGSGGDIGTIKRQLKSLLRGGCEEGIGGSMESVGNALVEKAEEFKKSTNKQII